MQNDGKIQRRLIVLVILNIIVLVSVFVLSNFTYAQEDQELHKKTLEEITKHTLSKQIANIPVGASPQAIGITRDTNNIYVVNTGNDSVSVIDGRTNTRVKDIKVRTLPQAIGINKDTDRIYVVNTGNDSVSVIDEKTNTRVKDIKVGASPRAIGINRNTDRIYVASYGDILASGDRAKPRVSVIDGRTNTWIKDIKVGASPSAIGINERTNIIYVATAGNDSVSVIDGRTNTWIKDIKVGTIPINILVAGNSTYVANAYSVSVIDGRTNTWIKDITGITNGISPQAIGINRDTDSIYFANQGNDSVSVIDGRTNTWIKDIKVGASPWAIGINERTNTTYAANQGDNTASVIDDIANKVVAKIMFDIKPFNAGRIECEKDKIAPIAQQFYLWSGSECTAKPNEGFALVSWDENLGGNSTQLLKFSPPSSPFDPILDFLHLMPDKPESTLNITKFGSFTANFKALPPPIPPEYVATLFTVIATAFIGSWLTPTVIEWRKAKKQGSKLDHYHNEVKSLYNDGRLDTNDIKELNNLRDNVTDEYTRGKINNEYYTNLKKEISVLYEEIFKKRIDSLNNLPENDKVKLSDEIKDDISDAYSKEKISELHYTLLKEKLSNFEKK
jgi:YVTN family beta-propeller protein